METIEILNLKLRNAELDNDRLRRQSEVHADGERKAAEQAETQSMQILPRLKAQMYLNPHIIMLVLMR